MRQQLRHGGERPSLRGACSLHRWAQPSPAGVTKEGLKGDGTKRAEASAAALGVGQGGSGGPCARGWHVRLETFRLTGRLPEQGGR